jgi:hypothetical protein
VKTGSCRLIFRPGRVCISTSEVGAIIIISSSWHIFRYFIPTAGSRTPADGIHWIAALMFPNDAAVGFSSSGAGALGTAALLGPASPRRSR